ncbi:App1 family protein [Pedobacter sp. MC2016-14]|uniref:App1 family protein n=1 Tax=Pedobacter sp. MC2016-14 TaxID=2897327 RepID=UPI001E4D50CE|nr:phosphatase domain-containing protein [Pedobacter sp. MC2016-14]MCD0487143.1 App1 family protein [Pedobacter sp. MC2016-14]
MNNSTSVKVYHGYGHTHNLVVYGHVFKHKAKTNQVYSNNVVVNTVHLLKLFVLRPYPFAKVRLYFHEQVLEQTAEYDGFFKFEWDASKAGMQDRNVAAGWHEVRVEAMDENSEVLSEGKGMVYVPHITQYAFISDVDDTVMVSHSATVLRRLRSLLFKNPRTRRTFKSTQKHYQLLAQAHTEANQPNPFFYVSSSEWNLYDYLVEMFRFNKLPEGVFLLNQIKRWKSFFKTGKTGHEGKLLRVMRILDAFPNQKFVFFGDNSQQDPEIYTSIAVKYPKNIVAIYIRNIRKSKQAETLVTLAKAEIRGISTLLFKNSEEAIAHSRALGLIDEV